MAKFNATERALAAAVERIDRRTRLAGTIRAVFEDDPGAPLPCDVGQVLDGVYYAYTFAADMESIADSYEPAEAARLRKLAAYARANRLLTQDDYNRHKAGR